MIFLFKSACDVHPNPGPDSNPIRICHANLRRLKSDEKLDELQFVSKDFDVIALSKTWLDRNYPDEILMLGGFQSPFRKDRPSGSGGGVILYVRDSPQR